MNILVFVRWGAVHCGALALGAAVATSCIDVEYPTVAFRCNPHQVDSCPETHFCCSDDPAAQGGALPNYEGKDISDGATPYFSGINNAVGTQGMCVDRGEVPIGAGLSELGAQGCPTPCNPTWPEEDIDVVCGTARHCCQTAPLQPEDCVLVDGQWRAATGVDINQEGESGLVITDWRRATHRTHQDPDGLGCLRLANGDAASEVFEDCVQQLNVADQRGFCIALEMGETCATQRTGFSDACQQLNAGG